VEKPEPLKDKIECFDGRPHRRFSDEDIRHFEDCEMYFSVNDVASAVQWLKDELYKLGFELQECVAMDRVIDKAFADVLEKREKP